MIKKLLFGKFPKFIIGFLFSSTVQADESCLSKIFITRDCVPKEIVDETISGSTGVPFYEVVKAIYSRGIAVLGKNNTPIFELGGGPDKILASSNLALTKGLFGRDYETLRQGQQEMFSAFCEKNGGQIKTSGVLAIGREQGRYNESKLAICQNSKGEAVGGLITQTGVDGQLGQERLYAYYLSAPLAQSVVDFRSSIKPGDKPQFGIVVDVRTPLAKVQVGKGERWHEIEKLVPYSLRELARY